MAAITSVTTGPYTNVSSTALFTGCGPCTYVQIVDPAIGKWNVPAPNSIPALRTTQLFIDLNHNTTSTSIDCNTPALSQYRTSNDNTVYPYAEPLYGLDDKCNLLVTWGALDKSQTSGGRSGLGTYGVTATMTGSVGEALFLGPYIYVLGEVYTTDSTGSPSCLANTYLDFTTPIGQYTDLYSRTYTTILPRNSREHEIFGTFLLLPELSTYVQGYDAVFEQCTLINPGGSPIALTPAKEIILPVKTIPASQPAASATTTLASPSDIETRLPSKSDVPALPASTTRSRHSAAPITTPEPENPEATQGEPTSRPETDGGEKDTAGVPQPPISLPTRLSDSPSQSSPNENHRAQTSSQPAAHQPSSSTLVSVETLSPLKASDTVSPVTSSPGDAAGDAAGDVPVSSQHLPWIIPVVPLAGQFQQATDIPPVIEIAPVNSAAAPDGVVATSTVQSVQGIGSVEPVSGDSNAYFIGRATIVRAGGPAVIMSGSVYSALPSGLGVVATKQPVDPFARYIAGGISGQDFVISDGGPDDGTYVIETGAALTAGKDAAIISGTTWSALPSGSGVVVAADGQTTTFDAAALTQDSPSNNVEAYVIGGSTTISAGGVAMTYAGTTFSALPSGAGVVAIKDGRTATLAKSAIEQHATALTSTYVIGGNATISADGSATAISGTTYSVLPSGAGVVIIEDGGSSTIRPNGGAETTSIGDGDDDVVASFTGSASTSRKQLKSIACWAAGVAVLAAF